MKFSKKTGEFLSKKDFDLFKLSIFRADGQIESPTIFVEKDYLIFRDSLYDEKNPMGTSYEITYPLHDLQRILPIIFNAIKKRDYERVSFVYAEKTIFMDIWER